MTSPDVQWANAVLAETERRMKAQAVDTAMQGLENKAGSGSPRVPQNVKDAIVASLDGAVP